MSFITRARQWMAGMIAPEARSTDPRNPLYWLRMLGMETSSGIEVNEQNAFQSAGFLCGVSQIADAIAMMPLNVYKRGTNGSRERQPDHALWSLLRESPNDWMTSSVWFETMITHGLTVSNAYARIYRDGGDEVRAFIPIAPGRISGFVEKESPSGSFFPRLKYRIDGSDIVDSRDILHVRTMAWDGITGRSRIEMGKDVIGLSLGSVRYAGGFYKQGGVPPLAIIHPLSLTEGAYGRIRKDWDAHYGGIENAGKVAILEEDAKIQQVGVDAEKAQLSEAREQGVTDMARLLKIPPHMVGDLKHATFSNIEHQALQFVTYTLLPWMRRIEQEVNFKCFSADEKADGFFVEFDASVLLKGDLKSRYEAYKIGREGGWLSVNDIKAKENMDPIGPEGDVLLQPMNMQPLGAEPKEADPPVAVPDLEDEADEEEQEEVKSRANRGLRRAV